MTLVQPQATLGGLGHRGNVQVLAAQLRKKQAAAAAGKETAAAGTGTSSRPSSQQVDAAAGPLFVAHGWQHMDEEQLQVVLPPDEPLLIVPSTHGPGKLAQCPSCLGSLCPEQYPQLACGCCRCVAATNHKVHINSMCIRNTTKPCVIGVLLHPRCGGTL
jgi:hypothetical protein